MAETFVIRLPGEPDVPVSWVVVNDIGAQTGESGSAHLAEAARSIGNRRVIVLVPATRVLRLRAEIPLRSMGRILQALPFALEEQIAQDVDTLHFAASERDAGGQIPVAVVDKESMQQWTEQLRGAGIDAYGMYADSDGIAALPATTTLLLETDCALLRDQHGNTTVGDPASLDLMLELFMAGDGNAPDEENTRPEPINLLVFCEPEQHDENLAVWERLRTRLESVDIKVLGDGALPKLATHIVASPGVNLLQGAYARRSDYAAIWPYWRAAAILLLALFGLTLAVKGAGLVSMERQETRLDQAAETILRNNFPDVRQVRDPWGQLQSQLNIAERGAAGTATDFIDALKTLAEAAAEIQEITMETVNYRNGILTLRLQAPSVDSLDRLQQLVSRSGKFSADIQSANPTDEGIEGRMQIKGRGG
ncbi:MAG: type II secretion system protein GspL [Gammaproteobacteria bacterium]